LESILIDFLADMVVNLDETSYCDWIDAGTEPMVVPEGFSDVKTSVSAQHQSKRSTLLGAVTAGGGQLNPLVTIHYNTIDTELCESGLTPGYVCSRTQQNTFIL
jgi:hypothetical protein